MKAYGLPVFGIVGIALVLTLVTVLDAEAKKRAYKGIPDSFSALSEQASPAVVNISTVKIIKGGGRVFRHFFMDPRSPRLSRPQFPAQVAWRKGKQVRTVGPLAMYVQRQWWAGYPVNGGLSVLRAR